MTCATDRRATADRARLPALAGAPAHHNCGTMRSSYTARSPMVAGLPRLCISTRAAPPSATARASKESSRRAVTSLIIVAPAPSVARATSAFDVSMEIGMRSRPASASTTGTTRSRSVREETGVAPGRVDSPPMSIRSAPSASILSAASTARAGSSIDDVSAKESGVTLRIPITRQRSPRRSASRPGRWTV